MHTAPTLPPRRRLRPLRLALVAALAAVLPALAACGSSPSASTFTAGSDGVTTESSVNTTDLSGRPASPVRIRIVSPAPGATVKGPTMHVVVAIDGGVVVKQTTRNITPTEGHVHLYVDQVLIYMAYSLQQDVPVHPGTFQLQAEFVAADHVPFNPRVVTSEFVTVTA